MCRCKELKKIWDDYPHPLDPVLCSGEYSIHGDRETGALERRRGPYSQQLQQQLDGMVWLIVSLTDRMYRSHRTHTSRVTSGNRKNTERPPDQ